MSVASLPLFRLYGDLPDDQAFDFIHIETIASRASVNDWTIRPHRHCNLYQILIIERGDGEMVYEATRIPFAAPAAILVAPTVAHGFHFAPHVTDGWVLSFSDDVAETLGDRRTEALERLKSLAANPVVPLADDGEALRLSSLCAELQDEALLAREGFRLVMRGYLTLVAVGAVRLAASQARTGAVTLKPADAIVDALRRLIEQNFRTERRLGSYARKLKMTPDRLNDHVKRATGVTAGHLIRERLLTEAKRQLVFTNTPIHEIAYDLAFLDPSYFARFFRRHTGTTPQAFRKGGDVPRDVYL